MLPEEIVRQNLLKELLNYRIASAIDVERPLKDYGKTHQKLRSDVVAREKVLQELMSACSLSETHRIF